MLNFVLILTALIPSPPAFGTTKVTFEVHRRRCEIWLAPRGPVVVNADSTTYTVERSSLPLHGLTSRAFQWASRVKTFDLGEALEVHGRGVGNRFAGLVGLLLRDIVEGPADGDPYRQDILRARAEFSPRELEIARETLEYARGRTLGRAVEITLRAVMPNAIAGQHQRAVLLLPDATYPEGLIISGSGTLPTFRRVLNVVYDGSTGAGALIRPARIQEARRPPSFRAIESRPRRPGPPRRLAKIIE